MSDSRHSHTHSREVKSFGNAIHIDRLHTKRGGHTPYGYAYLDGQLIIDPKEQIIVRKIVKLHQSGLYGNAIAKESKASKWSNAMRLK